MDNGFDGRNVLCVADKAVWKMFKNENVQKMPARKCHNHVLRVRLRLYCKSQIQNERVGLLKLQIQHQGSNLPVLQYAVGVAVYSNQHCLYLGFKKESRKMLSQRFKGFFALDSFVIYLSQNATSKNTQENASA